MVKVVKTAPYNWSQKYPGITVRAYLTQTAGLAVCKTHRLRLNNEDKTTEAITLRTWDIITYPSGESVIQRFKTKAEAVYVAEHELAKFSWVCLFFTDFEKNNDMKAVRAAIVKAREGL